MVVVNVQVALAPYAQTPASVLGHGVNHVVEEADACVDRDLLRRRFLGSMVLVDLLTLAIEILLVVGGPEVAMLVRWEVAAIEVYRDLDLRLVRVAVEAAGSRHCGSIVRGMCFGGCGVVNDRGKAQKVETDSEGLPHAPRHVAKRYRAGKVWPTNESPNQSLPQNFDIAKSRPQYKNNIRKTPNQRAISHLHNASSLIYYQLATNSKK